MQEREQAIKLDGFIADLAALRLVSRRTAKFLNIIPLAVTKSDALIIAASDPEDVRISQELRGRELIFVIAAREDIAKNLDKIYDFYQDAKLTFDAAPASFIADFLLAQAVKSGASDLHIENVILKFKNLNNRLCACASGSTANYTLSLITRRSCIRKSQIYLSCAAI